MTPHPSAQSLKATKKIMPTPVPVVVAAVAPPRVRKTDRPRIRHLHKYAMPAGKVEKAILDWCRDNNIQFQSLWVKNDRGHLLRADYVCERRTRMVKDLCVTPCPAFRISPFDIAKMAVVNPSVLFTIARKVRPAVQTPEAA